MGRRKKALPLVELIEERQKLAQELAVFWDGLYNHILELRRRREEGLIETLYRCPPGSVLERVVNLFWEHTDIPLNMVFWMALTVLGGYLTQRGVKVKLGSQELYTNLWTLVLGESGTGKTFSIKVLRRVLGGEDVYIHEPSYQSKAALVHDLKQDEKARKAVVVIDEFGQVLKLIHSKSEDLKQAFLLAYDGEVEHTTKKEGKIVIEDVALSIVAATVLSVFHQIATPEDLLDGLMQRFLMVEARQNERDFENWPYIVPDWKLNSIREACKDFVSRVDECDILTASPEAIEVWRRFYFKHWNPDLESHYKRYLFSALKIAGIYYYLTDGHGGEITPQHMGWALRALDDSLESLYNFMAKKGFDKWSKLADRVERYLAVSPKAKVRDILRALKIKKAHLEIACRILVQRGKLSKERFTEMFGKEVA